MTTNFKHSSFDDFYDVYEHIASGHFAIVRKCIERNTGIEYAAKFIRKQKTIGSRRGAPINDIIREISILRNALHPNIVQLYDVFENSEEIILVLELIKGGELFALMSAVEKLDEETAAKFMREILLGLNHLHLMNIAHLDLKPENILLLHENSYRIKLIDFGLSQKLSSVSDIRNMRGTPEFIAPEIVNYEPLSLATDMWSIGVIAFIMISGVSPFLGDTNQETFANITALNYDFDNEYFESSSDLVKDFISGLLVRNPRKRYTVRDCLNHPWIQKINPFLPNIVPSAIILNHSHLKRVALIKQRWKYLVRIVIFLLKLLKKSEKKLAVNGRYIEANHSYRQRNYLL